MRRQRHRRRRQLVRIADALEQIADAFSQPTITPRTVTLATSDELAQIRQDRTRLHGRPQATPDTDS